MAMQIYPWTAMRGTTLKRLEHAARTRTCRRPIVLGGVKTFITLPSPFPVMRIGNVLQIYIEPYRMWRAYMVIDGVVHGRWLYRSPLKHRHSQPRKPLLGEHVDSFHCDCHNGLVYGQHILVIVGKTFDTAMEYTVCNSCVKADCLHNTRTAGYYVRVV